MRDWSDVLPSQVAISQASWDRGIEVLRMREIAKMTYEKIGQRLGLSKGRVGQIYAKAVRSRSRSYRSPIEKYFSDSACDLEAIARSGHTDAGLRHRMETEILRMDARFRVALRNKQIADRAYDSGS